jgi:hypothetical protein
MKRLPQLVLVVSFTLFSWLAMQVMHECGHVLAAWLSGADISRVVLHPLEISRTELAHNPRPLAVVWGGPLAGSAIPLVILLIAHLCRFPAIYMFRVFAGFCLIANGMYIAFGPSHMAADTGTMLHFGTPRWVMLTFGTATVALGLFLWHGQGVFFGLGKARGRVDRRAAGVSLLLLLALTGVELIFWN